MNSRTTGFRKHRLNQLHLELLEPRLNLAGDMPSDCAFSEGAGESARAVHAINCFAADLYQHMLAEDGNLVVSPLSIATALSMTYAGAGGETAEELEQLLHFGDDPGIHESFHALISSLDKEGDRFDPSLANALFPQLGYRFQQEFLDLIAANYRGGTQELDYGSDPEAARETINSWIEEQTEGKISDLIPQGVIDQLTRLVLVNATHFQAEWHEPFKPELTTEARFTTSSGETVDVNMMVNDYSGFSYTEINGFQVLEMPLAPRPMPEETFFLTSLHRSRLSYYCRKTTRTSMTSTQKRCHRSAPGSNLRVMRMSTFLCQSSR